MYSSITTAITITIIQSKGIQFLRAVIIKPVTQRIDTKNICSVSLKEVGPILSQDGPSSDFWDGTRISLANLTSFLPPSKIS